MSGNYASELEAKVAALEEKIAVLEEQLLQLTANAEKKEAVKKEKKEKKEASKKDAAATKASKLASDRERHIESIMAKTGWTHDETVEKVTAAIKNVGINYTRYDNLDFHLVPEHKQAEEYKKLLEERTAKTKSEKRAKKNEKLIHTVMENTGWTYEMAKEKMDHSTEICGAEYKDYAAYRFWELDDATQRTYFTKGMANALRKKYNTNKKNINCFVNKNEFDEVFSDFLGRPWAHVPNVSYEEFVARFAGEPKIIYKPLSDSCGHGVTVFALDGEEDIETVYNKLIKLPEGVVEGYVIQHPAMSKYSRKSVNTVRIVSVRDFGRVNILYAAFRMGGGEAVVDNFHAGGVLALINPETGIVETNAIDLGGTFYENHPVTGEKILGFQIPFWPEIVELLQKAGKIVKGVGYVGWDVAVTENGPVLIEGNTAPAPNVLQTPYAKEHKGMAHVVEKYLK